MFTGIIEEKGYVEGVYKKPNLLTLKISANKVTKGIKLGDSIAVNGVCLTVSGIHKDKKFLLEVMKETIDRTTLKDLKPGSLVNLERALKVSDRLGGHFVSGHVDEVADVLKIIKKENYLELRISMWPSMARFLVPKGSVAVDGVSLTVGVVSSNYFQIYLIPHTLKGSTLGLKKKGDQVNIETDLLAKYIFGKRK